jgi:uncharacterized protein with von Willebrand factor type A (vWA) domain
MLETYDQDANGRLSQSEMLHMLQSIGAQLSDEALAKSFAEAQQDNVTDSQDLDAAGLARLFRTKAFCNASLLRKLHSLAVHGPDGEFGCPNQYQSSHNAIHSQTYTDYVFRDLLHCLICCI